MVKDVRQNVMKCQTVNVWYRPEVKRGFGKGESLRGEVLLQPTVEQECVQCGVNT